MKTLGNILDNKTSETLTKAEQLNTDLNEFNVLIEGELAFYSFSFFYVASSFFSNQYKQHHIYSI